MQLQSAAAALPADAVVIYRHDIGPRQDSCDGRPGTQGWTEIVVQIHFRTTQSATTVLQNAEAPMAKQGWKQTIRSDRAQFWTMPVNTDPSAGAVLQHDDDSTWTLYAHANARGELASGC
jgi:hypothetical protein